MKKLPLISLIFSMTVFGTIGIFKEYIPLPSAFIAMFRGLVGALFVLIFLLVSKKRINFSQIKRNFPILLISGAFIGINWILLFESYNHTTVAIATLCYYMSPLFVTVASLLFFKEKLTLRKGVCILTAVFGMVLVSGVIEGEIPKGSMLIGIILGIAAAVFYASVTLMNKKTKDISPLDITLVQLFVAAITVMPYSLIFEDISFSGVSFKATAFLFIIGILHTGIAYVCFFESVKKLEASKVAIFSYLDPIVAIILSALILKEEMTVATGIGAVLIIMSALISEVNIFAFFKKKGKK